NDDIQRNRKPDDGFGRVEFPVRHGYAASFWDLYQRTAFASRKVRSGYSGSVPTSGRIFQLRAHFLPSALPNTTPTPSILSSVKASVGAASVFTVACDVMQISAMSFPLTASAYSPDT